MATVRMHAAFGLLSRSRSSLRADRLSVRRNPRAELDSRAPPIRLGRYTIRTHRVPGNPRPAWTQWCYLSPTLCDIAGVSTAAAPGRE